MVLVPSIAERIAYWKHRRRALILAHHYQDQEIQEIADVVGDTLQLILQADRHHGEVIVLCGVRFMAEMTKVVNPSRIVLLPDAKAGCSLVDSCPAEAIRAFRRKNPRHIIVSYMNTSVLVKAESDILCTSTNAVAVVNSIPPRTPILFLPDSNLGNWVKQQTGRSNMQVWQGACIVHATFPLRRLTTIRAKFPDALIAAHPGCPSELIRIAHFVGSASAIAEWCGIQHAADFIILAESGIRYTLEKNNPGKCFHFVENESCNCSECPYLRANTLEKLLACLETLSPSIELEDNIISRARLPFERMMQVK